MQSLDLGINVQLLENALKITGLNNKEEVINLALAQFLRTTKQNEMISQTEEKGFNPQQFFGVSHLKNLDQQLEEMRNEWER
jgi:hypothetical protein